MNSVGVVLTGATVMGDRTGVTGVGVGDEGAPMVNAVEAGLSGDARMDFRKDLSSGHFAPNVPGTEFTKVDLLLHCRLELLDVIVDHGNTDDTHEEGDCGENDAKEGDRPK